MSMNDVVKRHTREFYSLK